MSLKVLGGGPLAQLVRDASAANSDIEFLGRRPLDEVYRAMGEAAMLVLPSVWYEGLPKVLIESFAKATPVVASRLGSLAELVADGQTGLHFEPNDAADLARQVDRLGGDGAARSQMRSAARADFERKYTAERNIRLLTETYELALRRRHAATVNDSALAGASSNLGAGAAGGSC